MAVRIRGKSWMVDVKIVLSDGRRVRVRRPGGETKMGAQRIEREIIREAQSQFSPPVVE